MRVKPGQKRSPRPTPRKSVPHPLGTWLPFVDPPGPRKMLQRLEAALGNWAKRAGAGVLPTQHPRGEASRGYGGRWLNMDPNHSKGDNVRCHPKEDPQE